jgi:hypothetical protein
MTFNSIGCSGTMIGRNTMVTAAHCLYETIVANAWKCSDATLEPCVGETGTPLLRGGVNGLAGVTAWASCYRKRVPDGFVNLTTLSTVADGTAFAKFDYAVVDFTGGGFCSNPTMDDGGWVGTGAFSDAVIAANSTARYGYPQWATCSANVNGSGPAECPAPNGALRYNGGSGPQTGAQLWGSWGLPGATVKAPTNSADALVSTLDWTPGDSGASVMAFVDNGWRVIGMVSNSVNPNANFAARWTSTVHNFVDANSPFPADTM